MSLFNDTSETVQLASMWKVWVFGVVSLMVGAMAEADPMAKFTSEYDRGNDVQNANRADLWEQQDMIGQGIAPEVIGNIPGEISQVEIPAQASAVASQLITVVQTLQENPAYQDKLGRVSGATANPDDTEYGHDAHYTNLLGRAKLVEQTIMQGQ
jgi:hypothetical protein